MSVRKDAPICKIIFTLKRNVSEFKFLSLCYVCHYVVMLCSHNCRIKPDRLRGVGLSLAVSARSSVVWSRPWSMVGVVKNVQMFTGQPVLPLLPAAVSYAAEQTVFCPVGDTITLSLVLPMPKRISRILWKYKSDMVADWTHGHFLSYGRFKDRTTVDNTTGLLEIRSGTTEYSGNIAGIHHTATYGRRQGPSPKEWQALLTCVIFFGNFLLFTRFVALYILFLDIDWILVCKIKLFNVPNYQF